MWWIGDLIDGLGRQIRVDWMAIMERAGVSGSRNSVGQRRGSGTVADQGELEQVRISVQAPALGDGGDQIER